MPDGYDISEHQTAVPDCDFVIIRAYNENGFPDTRFQQHWTDAGARGIPRGVYGWPIPTRDNKALGYQLVTLCPDAELGYWADVEHSSRGIASPQEVEDYLTGIGNNVRGFYSNIGDCPRTPMLDQEMWWMADYGPNDGTRHDPNEQPPVPARPFVMHQYTSNPLDRNYTATLDWAGADMPLNDADKLWITSTVANLLGVSAGKGETTAGPHNVDGSAATIAQVVGDVAQVRKQVKDLSDAVAKLALGTQTPTSLTVSLSGTAKPA